MADNSTKGKMKAFLRTKGLWTIVSGAEKCPDDSKADLQAKWDLRADKATGQLYLSLSAEQRTHIDAVQDDPAQIVKSNVTRQGIEP